MNVNELTPQMRQRSAAGYVIMHRMKQMLEKNRQMKRAAEREG